MDSDNECVHPSKKRIEKAGKLIIETLQMNQIAMPPAMEAMINLIIDMSKTLGVSFLEFQAMMKSATDFYEHYKGETDSHGR